MLELQLGHCLALASIHVLDSSSWNACSNFSFLYCFSSVRFPSSSSASYVARSSFESPGSSRHGETPCQACLHRIQKANLHLGHWLMLESSSFRVTHWQLDLGQYTMSFISSSVRCSKRESKRSKSSYGTSSLMTAMLILDVQLLLGQSIAVTSPSVIFAETCEVIQSLQCTCSQRKYSDAFWTR